MKSIKEILERKLGKLSQESVDFAVEQFKKNAQQAGKPNKKLDTPEALDELSMDIDFYYERMKGARVG